MSAVLAAHGLTIEWWGHAEELAEGKGEFPRMVRRWFWDSEREDPVSASEWARFRRALDEYGL